jgi:hypothetical protein
MKNQRLINAISKAGFEVKKSQDSMTILYIASNGDLFVSWWVSIASTDGRAQCVHCGRFSDPSDSMIDYFPGYFARTIKSAVNHLINK